MYITSDNTGVKQYSEEEWLWRQSHIVSQKDPNWDNRVNMVRMGNFETTDQCMKYT